MKIQCWAMMSAVLLSISALSGCGASSGAQVPAAQKKPEPAPVRVTKAALRTIPTELRAVGQVEALATVEIRSQVGGEIIAVHFKEGDLVQEGQPLFQIDPRPYENALKMAEAKLGMAHAGLRAAQSRIAERKAEAENANTVLKRDQTLLDGQMVTREEFDRSRTLAETARAALAAEQASAASAGNEIESAQVEIERAKLDLSYCDIKAPFTGRTGSLLLHKGDLARVNDATPLVTLVQTKPINVSFTLPEKQLAELRMRMANEGLPVSVLLPGQEESPISAMVNFVENTVDTRTSTIRLKASTPNDDERLWPGQFVEVRVQMSVLENAVAIPAEALQTGQKGAYVYVIKEDLTAELRPVTPGATKDGFTAILEGLSDGETLVREGQLRVAPGAKVSVLSDASTTEAPKS